MLYMAQGDLNLILFTIDFYQEQDETKPVCQFIKSCTVQMKAKVIGDLYLLEEYGNHAREPLSKHLECGIFELRSKVGTNIVRIFTSLKITELSLLQMNS